MEVLYTVTDYRPLVYLCLGSRKISLFYLSNIMGATGFCCCYIFLGETLLCMKFGFYLRDVASPEGFGWARCLFIMGFKSQWTRFCLFCPNLTFILQYCKTKLNGIVLADRNHKWNQSYMNDVFFCSFSRFIWI